MSEPISLKNFRKVYDKMECEGGLEGLILHSSVPKEVIGTELEEPFKAFVKAYNDLDKKFNEVMDRLGDQLDE